MIKGNNPIGWILPDSLANRVPETFQVTGDTAGEQYMHLGLDVGLPGYEQQRKFPYTSNTERAIIAAGDALWFTPLFGRGAGNVGGRLAAAARQAAKDAKGYAINNPYVQAAVESLTRQRLLNDMYTSGILTRRGATVDPNIIDTQAAWSALSFGQRQAPTHGGLWASVPQRTQRQLALIRQELRDRIAHDKKTTADEAWATTRRGTGTADAGKIAGRRFLGCGA